MKTKVSKRKLFLVAALLVPILLYIIFIYGVKTGDSEVANKIFDIKNTQEVYNYPDSKVITIVKHFMITNPPDDLYELKKLVEKFIQDNPIDRKNELDKNKDRHYYVYFYRKSKKLPVNWQPNEAYMNTDRIEYHKNDCIAIIKWSDLYPQKIYDIMKKSSDKADYGSTIEKIH